MPGNWGLIDLDTPQEQYTHTSFRDGKEMQLVFSDEFNTDGRSFYPGDDPYWEAGAFMCTFTNILLGIDAVAVDLHYWGVSLSISVFHRRSERRLAS